MCWLYISALRVYARQCSRVATHYGMGLRLCVSHLVLLPFPQPLQPAQPQQELPGVFVLRSILRRISKKTPPTAIPRIKDAKLGNKDSIIFYAPCVCKEKAARGLRKIRKTKKRTRASAILVDIVHALPVSTKPNWYTRKEMP